MNMKLLKRFQAKQRSVEERLEAGKALRKKSPRTEQGDYKPSGKRTDPVSVLEAQAKTRLPDLVPIRYARMLASPFAFLRGGAAIMAAELTAHGKTTGLQVQGHCMTMVTLPSCKCWIPNVSYTTHSFKSQSPCKIS